MAYKIIVSPRAQNEIEEAVDYYSRNSIDAPEHFFSFLKNAFNELENKPFLRIRYKNIRAINIRKFPFLLYFVINERKKTVRILSCFHNKRNPGKRPRS